MTDGIGKIGGSPYGFGNFYSRQNTEDAQNKPAEQPVVQPEAKEVDPNKVMEFLNANNLFVAPKSSTAPAELAPDVQDRVVNAMERFEEVYAVVVNEFGEKIAPEVMNLYMDMSMALA